MNSTHKVEVVRLGEVKRHENADSLEVSNVFGYSVVFKEGQYKSGDLVAFVPPDSILPLDNPEYEWLGPKRLVRAKKLRGIPSFGLLLKATEGSAEGNDVTAYFDVTHYEPPTSMDWTGGEAEKGPEGWHPCYDVDSGKRYNYLLTPGELVNCTEKIHGCNGRFRYDNNQGRMFCGSKSEWKRPDEKNVWWKALAATPSVEKFCRENDVTVYGEVAGQIQKNFSYGLPKGESRIFVFDILKDGRWLDYDEARDLTSSYDLPWVPEIARNIPYDYDKLCELAEGQSLVPGAQNIREGLVFGPVKERSDYHIGRIKLKIVGVGYLSMK